MLLQMPKDGGGAQAATRGVSLDDEIRNPSAEPRGEEDLSELDRAIKVGDDFQPHITPSADSVA